MLLRHRFLEDAGIFPVSLVTALCHLSIIQLLLAVHKLRPSFILVNRMAFNNIAFFMIILVMKVFLLLGNVFGICLRCFWAMSNEQISLSYLFDV